MNWNHNNHIITNDIINSVKNILKVDFPEDFLSIIKEYDGVIQATIKLIFVEMMKL